MRESERFGRERGGLQKDTHKERDMFVCGRESLSTQKSGREKRARGIEREECGGDGKRRRERGGRSGEGARRAAGMRDGERRGERRRREDESEGERGEEAGRREERRSE